MNENSSPLQMLRENNPFMSLNSPFPWDNNNPDISQLNREASEEIEQLIRHKRRTPAEPLAGLILGGPGSGKTHMLMRILRRMRNNAQPAVFVAVRAFRDPESVMQHILSEIFINLKLSHSNGRSQFDILASEVMSSYNERRRTDGFDSIEKIDTRTYLLRDIPNIDHNFLKCVMLYLSSNDEAVKADVLEWLCNGLGEDDAARLGLPPKDLYSMTEARRESIAEKTLISLGLILAYARMPMIVCFDQLDAMKEKSLIEAWGGVISLLMNDLSGVLPLCFLKAETWEDIFRPALDTSVIERVEHNKMIMKECSAQQARQLVHEKIAAVFPDDTENIYQWLISRMSDVLRAGLSPRKVIELASNAITGDKPIDEVIHAAYNEELERVKASPNSWPPNSEYLKLALEGWLSSQEGFKLIKSPGKYIKVQAVHGDKKFAFIIIIPRIHSTGIAGLNEGIKFLREYPGSFCCYVLEEKSHKKTWRKFAEKLEEFERSGGFTARLTKDSRITWYALAALINRIDNVDVSIYSASGSKPRPASRNDIPGFVRTLRLIDAKDFTLPAASIKYSPPDKKSEPSVYYNDELFSGTLRNILTASPMKILAVDKAAELLSQRGIKVGRNEVLSFLRNNAGTFRTFSSKNDILITLAEN